VLGTKYDEANQHEDNCKTSKQHQISQFIKIQNKSEWIQGSEENE